MTYRELLELYKKNELDEQKKIEVESDIEKQEAISDFLYENEDIPELETSFQQNILQDENTTSKQECEFTKMVNRSIRRAFLKMGTVIGAVILIVMLFVQFVLPKIVSSFYYNPGLNVAKDTNQMSLDMAVYSELALPCYYRNNVYVEDNGYGNYDICINQRVSFNDTMTNVAGKIDKGKLTLYDINVLNRPPVGVFAWFKQLNSNRSESLTALVPENDFTKSVGGRANYEIEKLKDLNDNTKYVAYVTLDKIMKYEDFMSFLSGKYDLNSVWCAVCTNGDDTSVDSMFHTANIGFQCTLTYSDSLNWNHSKYPSLLLWDNAVIIDGDTNQLQANMQTESFMTTHFTSMLRYLSDQKKFLSMMNEYDYDYSDAADYVAKNGLNIYGFAAIADKNTLLKLNKDSEVYQIITQPLK